MNKDPTVYILHIYDCLLRIEEYVSDGDEVFFVDHKAQDAVIRNLEIIGQSVKDLQTQDLADKRADIPWSRIAGMRNVLAHQYLGVDLKLVWKIVEQDLPSLKDAILDIGAGLGINFSQTDL